MVEQNNNTSRPPGREIKRDVERHHAIFNSVTFPLNSTCRDLSASAGEGLLLTTEKEFTVIHWRTRKD